MGKSISFKKKEGGGIINDIFKNIHEKWDIFLSESVSQEGGEHHITSIICEPKVPDVDKEIQELKSKMSKNGFKVSAKSVYIDKPDIVKFKKD